MKQYCTIPVAKTKALISFAFTAKLICVFVFAYADCWFSHAAAQLSIIYIYIAQCVYSVHMFLVSRNKSSTELMLIVET